MPLNSLRRGGRLVRAALLLSLCLTVRTMMGQTTAPAAPPAALTGTVTDPNGGLIPGAQLILHPPAPAPDIHTNTDGDGAFQLGNIPPGVGNLDITAAHFAPATRPVELHAGETLTLDPVVLIPTVGEVVNVELPTYEAAERDMKIEEQQRLLGVLPNFFVSYKWAAPPLTAGQKFRLTTKAVLDPGNLAEVGVLSGIQQGLNSFPGYHQGLKGYARRFGADGANLVVGSYLGGAIYPSIFHQDPRFFYKADGTVRQRAWYAATRIFVTRGDNGRPQPNYSGMLGDMSAGAISNLYYAPSDRNGAALTIENGLLGIAGDTLNGLIQEFVFTPLTTHHPKSKKSSAP